MIHVRKKLAQISTIGNATPLSMREAFKDKNKIKTTFTNRPALRDHINYTAYQIPDWFKYKAGYKYLRFVWHQVYYDDCCEVQQSRIL